MAKISDLPAIAPATIDGTELVPVVKGGVMGRASLAALLRMFFRVVEAEDKLVVFTDGSDDEIELGYFAADGSFVAHKYGGPVGNLIVRYAGEVDDGSGDLLQILDNTEDSVFLLRIAASGTVYGKFDGLDPAALATAMANSATALTKANEALAKASAGSKAQLLRALALRAQENNPFELAVMDAPPTITCGVYAGLPSGISQVYAYNSGASNVVGGELVDNGSNYGVHSVSYASGGNLSNGRNALHWGVEFETDAPKVFLRLQADPSSGYFRTVVDGRHPTKLFTQINSTGGASYVMLDFGSRKSRLIRFECVGNTRFQSVNVGPQDRIWKPSTGDCIRMAWVADSFGEGLSARGAQPTPYTPGETWPHVTAAYLGIRNVRQCAIGGTGYNKDGNSGGVTNKWKFGDHISDWITWSPDLVALVGSVNDDGTDVSVTANIALAVWQATRAALPTVPIVIGGLMTTSANANLVLIENTLKARFDTWADPNSLFIPICTDPEGAWLTGTGYDAAPGGNGNVDFYRGDNTHLNPSGDRWAGKRFARKIRSWLVTR